MPSLFRDDKFLAQIDEFEHQMVVVQQPSGEFVDAYGVNCGPYMLLFQEEELDDLVAFAKAVRDGMTTSKKSPAATEARAIASVLAQNHQAHLRAAKGVKAQVREPQPEPLMPMVDASTQMTPPRSPSLKPKAAPVRMAAPRPANAEAGPSRHKDAVVDEKAPPSPVRPQAATAAPPAPAAPRVHIISPPRTPCMAQPVALLGCLVGMGQGVVMGLAYAGVLAPSLGYGAAVLFILLMLFMAGAPPFHSTYPNRRETAG
ncbi:hypothetical protein Q3G72_003541 [Acer saccharum]|nr:hypothetical protein Q3G72_003541 [Acer saccharum]